MVSIFYSTGLSDTSPRDSPTHVVVGRLSDHDYISIKSRESPTPRNIVINIENLRGGSSSLNQYTVHKGIHTTLPNTVITQNGTHSQSNNGKLADENHSNENLTSSNSAELTESDSESVYNNLEAQKEIIL